MNSGQESRPLTFELAEIGKRVFLKGFPEVRLTITAVWGKNGVGVSSMGSFVSVAWFNAQDEMLRAEINVEALMLEVDFDG